MKKRIVARVMTSGANRYPAKAERGDQRARGLVRLHDLSLADGKAYLHREGPILPHFGAPNRASIV
jgi:hypothetical protein